MFCSVAVVNAVDSACQVSLCDADQLGCTCVVVAAAAIVVDAFFPLEIRCPTGPKTQPKCTLEAIEKQHG